jgi:phosphoglycolate phosphatase-like HAD superfamily hydrolase
MRPEDTWMVGDHVTDLKAAREAGVNSAFMTYGIGALDGETPTRTFATFETFTLTFLDEPVP